MRYGLWTLDHLAKITSCVGVGNLGCILLVTISVFVRTREEYVFSELTAQPGHWNPCSALVPSRCFELHNV
ncbi:unnamed protein product [Calypogeia fissa]